MNKTKEQKKMRDCLRNVSKKCKGKFLTTKEIRTCPECSEVLWNAERYVSRPGDSTSETLE